MKKIAHLYNSLIVSSVYSYNKSKYTNNELRFITLFNLSTCLSINVLLIWLILYFEFYPGFTDFLVLKLLNDPSLNFLAALFLYIYLPIWIINYLLLFKGERYLTLMKKYPKALNTDFFPAYFFISITLLLIYNFYHTINN